MLPAEQIQPTGGRVLVRKKGQEQSSSVIYIESDYGGCELGVVLAVGPGDIPVTGGAPVEPRVKKGDVVLFQVADPNRTQAFRTDGGRDRDTLLISEREIWAIIKPA